MLEYLVRYIWVIEGRYGSELDTRKQMGALLVEAPSRVDAFAVAYDHLTRAGYAIDTNFTNDYDEGNRLEMTDNDLKLLRELGVPVDKHGGSTTVVSLTTHSMTLRGKVLSQENEPPDASG